MAETAELVPVVRDLLTELYALAGEELPDLSDEAVAAALGLVAEECAAPDCEDDCDEDCPTPLLEDAATLDVPDERQSENWSCGAAVVTAVARFFGVEPDTETEAVLALGSSPRDGTDPEKIVSVLDAAGLSTTALAGMDLDQLEWFVSRGIPVVTCIQAWEAEGDGALEAGHWVVVIGVDAENIVVMDPARFNPSELAGYGTSRGGQRVAIPRDEFVRRWRDADAEGNVYVEYGIAVRGPSA